ncbi:hypothetical protein [Planktothricoides raciborskii]|uniref:Uncharacterized protein n=1 Tax=Planktothricoides raciborskii GIHE-MW2 TaxID=2792601 RepID=A0AAU8JJ34_9CYAN
MFNNSYFWFFAQKINRVAVVAIATNCGTNCGIEQIKPDSRPVSRSLRRSPPPTFT